jgi:phosphopantothenoylcysteine decarboxylase
LRAWNPHIPILLAPAMNTQMYTHPITAHHLSMIKTHLPYIELINPIEKILACGDVGMGGMAEWGDVVGRVVRKLNLRIRLESDDVEDQELNGRTSHDTHIKEEDEDEDEGEEEDEEIRVGGEEHEDEKRDNEVREQEEEEEERQELLRLASCV